MDNNLIIAFVGMPGAGKTETTKYIVQKGIPFVRFGDVTDEGLKEENKEIDPQNEKNFREKLRKDLGMAAYAIKSKPKIDELLEAHDAVAIDGLYSWEEYIYLKKQYSQLVLVQIFAETAIRYQRLSKRPVRPLTEEEAFSRDVAEIEKLNKGGPIAMADYLIDDSGSIETLHEKLDTLFVRLTK